MARRHWLDPLARRLLIASGHLPAPAERSWRQADQDAAAREAAHEAAVEQELEALKRAQASGLWMSIGPRPATGESCRAARPSRPICWCAFKRRACS